MSRSLSTVVSPVLAVALLAACASGASEAGPADANPPSTADARRPADARAPVPSDHGGSAEMGRPPVADAAPDADAAPPSRDARSPTPDAVPSTDDARPAPSPDAGPDLNLPGGREAFVVALGHLDAAARSNWVRLGTYRFRPEAGEVDAAMYSWWQGDPVQREGIGTTPAGDCVADEGVHQCEVLSAGGFTGAPADVRTGTYGLTEEAGGVSLDIHWDLRGLRRETWRVEPAADGTWVKLALTDSDGATDGVAAGSHAPLSSRRATSSILMAPGPLDYHTVGWAHDALSRHHQDFDLSHYAGCDVTTWVATYLQPASPNNCQSGCAAGTVDTSIQYSLARVGVRDRRDTWWHWCTCLAGGARCYARNSHVKPMLQVLDDQAQFRGWVGVEASFSVPESDDPRGDDMLAVFSALTP